METIIVLLIIIDFLELGALICAMKKFSELAKTSVELDAPSEIDDDDEAKRYVRGIEGIMSYDPYK